MTTEQVRAARERLEETTRFFALMATGPVSQSGIAYRRSKAQSLLEGLDSDLRLALDALDRVRALADDLECHDNTGDRIDQAINDTVKSLRAALAGPNQEEP